MLAIFIVCTILTGGAVLRVAGGVFHGLGDAPSEDRAMALGAVILALAALYWRRLPVLRRRFAGLRAGN